MIKDNIKNAQIYYALSPLIEKGLKILQNTNWNNMQPGKYEFDENIYVNLDEYETKISDKIEAHKKYIDIQYMIKGEENIGISNTNNLTVCENYDETKDIMFFKGDVALYNLKQGEFMIFFPTDAHLPCQTVTEKCINKKAVAKIKWS